MAETSDYGFSFEALTVVSIENTDGGFKIGFGPGAKPEGDGKMYVIPRPDDGTYPIPNSLIAKLVVGDVLAWKDRESFNTELAAQRLLIEADKNKGLVN